MNLPVQPLLLQRVPGGDKVLELSTKFQPADIEVFEPYNSNLTGSRLEKSFAVVRPTLVTAQALLRSINTLVLSPPIDPTSLAPFVCEAPPQLTYFVEVSLSNALLQVSLDGLPPP